MMPEYDEWVNKHYERLAAVARSRVGLSGAMDAYEIVDTAVMRALASVTFPANDESIWWSWHCSAIRSAVSHALVSELRGRANVSAESAAAILSEAQRKKTRRREKLQVHPHTIRRKYPKPRWSQFVKFAHIVQVEVCKCGAPLWWCAERLPGGEVVHSLGCWNGHHQYKPQEA